MYLKLMNENIEEIKKSYNKPYYVYLSITNNCNANCIFCDVFKNENKNNILDIYKIIDDLKDLGCKYIHFTGGGEPFFNNEIFPYLEYATRKNIKINIITNGLNLNKEKIKKLSNYNIKNMFFSIDSYNSKTHNELRRTKNLYEKATENINLIKKLKPNIKIILNHVITNRNIDEFEFFIKMKEKVNFNIINPIIVKDCPSLFPTQEQIIKFNERKSEYYKLAKKLNIEYMTDIEIFNNEVNINGDAKEKENLKCVYANLALFIDSPTGLVYPCDCSIHRDRLIYNIGDLKKEGIKEIWNGRKRKKLSQFLINGKLECKLKCDSANCYFNNQYLKGEKNENTNNG